MTAKRRVIPVFVAHMGCPNDCVFCNQHRISGALKAADAETVYGAIADAQRLGQSGTPAELAFYGGSFTAIPEDKQLELLTAAQRFLALGSGNTIRVSTRPDFIDDNVIKRLKQFGVSTVEIGAQSMCDEVLRLSRRGHTARDVENAAKCIKKHGLGLVLQMMTGLPGDTRERSVYTAGRFIKLSPGGVRIYPAVVVRDTALYDMWRSGEYREHTVEDAVVLCAELAVMFESAKIPIIRLGLNPTDELSGGAKAAGAYHPAFGELVYSRIYLNRAIELLRGVPPGCDTVLGVARGRVSMMVGQKRRNIGVLTDMFALKSVKVCESDIEDGKIVVFRR